MSSASTSSEFSSSSPATPQVKMEQPELNNLPEKQPPALAEKGWLHGRSPTRGPLIVIAHPDALEQIVAHSHSNRQVELGGAMLGRAYQFEEQAYIEIQAVLPAVTGDHGPIHFTFTADSWTQLQRDRETNYPNLDIVGWFHTHPGLGVFYSGDDVVVHSAAFTLPWHVGLVLDPIRNEAAFFGWSEGELQPIAGFFELLGDHREPTIDWHMVFSSVWQESYEEHVNAKRGPISDVDARLEADLMPAPGRLGLIIGTLGLILTFFLLVGWVVPLTRQVKHLENLTLMLADETLIENSLSCPDPNLRILTPVVGSETKIGSEVAIIGTAVHPDAIRYRLEMRPFGTEAWTLVNAKRQDTNLGLLATWDTTQLQPAMYELRLTVVDRNNIRLADSPLCLITLDLGM